MKIPFPLAEGVNKIKHMGVGNYKQGQKQNIQFSPWQTCG